MGRADAERVQQNLERLQKRLARFESHTQDTMDEISRRVDELFHDWSWRVAEGLETVGAVLSNAAREQGVPVIWEDVQRKAFHEFHAQGLRIPERASFCYFQGDGGDPYENSTVEVGIRPTPLLGGSIEPWIPEDFQSIIVRIRPQNVWEVAKDTAYGFLHRREARARTRRVDEVVFRDVKPRKLLPDKTIETTRGLSEVEAVLRKSYGSALKDRFEGLSYAADRAFCVAGFSVVLASLPTVLEAEYARREEECSLPEPPTIS